MKRLLLILALLAFLLFGGSADAVTRYVRHGAGSGCSNGSTNYIPASDICAGGGTATVYTTVAAGVGAAQVGEPVLIRAGTYTEIIRNDTTPIRANVTIAAYPGNCVTAGTYGPGGGCENVILNGDAGNSDGLIELAMGSGVTGVTIDGLRIDATSAHYGIHSGSNTTIKNSEIYNAGNNPARDAGNGIFVPASVTGVTVTNNKIHDNGRNVLGVNAPKGGHGLYWQGSNGTVDGNEVYENGDHGIQVYCNLGGDVCTGGLSNNVIKNNYFHDNSDFAGFAGNGIYVMTQPGATAHKVYNNIIANGQGRGIAMASGSVGATVYSNTIYGQQSAGISLGTGSNYLVRNNIVWHNGLSALSDFYNDGTGGSATATNNLCSTENWSGSPCSVTSDPLFTNTSTQNFTLTAASPAKDAGATLGSPYNVDFLGLSRPIGANYDMGVYEFDSTTKYVKSTCTNGITTYNPTGSGGAGSCTGGSATVYNSIHNGVLALAPGDTLAIRAGTYNTNIDTRVGHAEAAMQSGTQLNPITIKAYSPTGSACATAGIYGPGGDCETVTIAGTGDDTAVGIGDKIWLVIDGLHVDAALNHYPIYPGNNTIVKNSELYNAGLKANSTGAGVFVGLTNHDITLQNNSIHDNGLIYDVNSPGHGIYMQGYNNIVDGNDVYGNGDLGMQIYCHSGDGNPDDCFNVPRTSGNVVKNNRFHNNGAQPLYGSVGGGLTIYSVNSGPSNVAYNNLVYSNPGRGISFTNVGSGPGVLVYSNTVWNNGSAGISMGRGSGHIVRNNIAWGNTGIYGLTDFYDDGIGGTVTAANNLCGSENWSGSPCSVISDPLFLSTTPGNANFLKINASSPAYEAGATLGSPYNSDFSGNARPQGTSYDIGAYEFSTSTPSPTISVTGVSSPGVFLSTGATATTTASTVTLSGLSECGTSGVSLQWINDRGGSGSASYAGGTGPQGWTASAISLTANRVNTITFTVNCTGGSSASVSTLVRANGADALVGEWGFNENTGSTVNDETANNFDLTFAGSGNTWVTGKYGAAVELNGSGWLTVPHDNKMDLSLMTLEAWVMPTAPSSAFKAILTSDDSSAYTYFLYATSAGYCGSGAPMGGIYSNNLGQYTVPCTSTPLTINVWSHIAITHDGINTKLYVNGDPTPVQTVASYGLPLEWSGTNLLIGKSPFGESFVGRIDEMRIYNYARSGAQIASDSTTAIGTPAPGSPANLTVGADAVIIYGADASVTIGAQ